MAAPKDLDPSSSPRAFLGAELRHAREAAGLSQDELGRPLFVSGSFIGQLEAGTRRMMPEYGVQFDKILDTKDFFERNCAALAESKYPEHFTEAAEAEAAATTIRHYLPLLIPGLLQTPEYAAALFRTYRPMAPEAEIEELVALRMERTHVLDDPTTPLFWGILDEAALRRPVGGAATMAKTLRHVADMARRHRIIVQVLPFSAGAHAGMGGSLKLMEFADAPPLCFVEGMDTGQLMDDPAKIARHSLTFSLLQAAALSPQDSLVFIEAVAQDYEHEEQHP
ncbi:helix-turn-helix domain-containing protein [Streptomyces turgidiscabies]|uniref:Transcriptional regulator with XRE-family HTH domain n=1 Tax=Streptomyces turgidiscabies TaxID=85558 RepID=A0ABU0RR57_9ACTN|nr:helix-turn-helix transcriptional regulator [Streptomyces turgidiscabies]MDQ0934475.1 transcriptional regulator with XRE-family HTH domain [Streptomyces turgidiscabies]